MSRKQDLLTIPLLSVKELAEKARQYAKSAKAPSTLRGYKADWQDFENWCHSHQLRLGPVKTEYSDDELPLDPDFATALLQWKLISKAGESGLVLLGLLAAHGHRAKIDLQEAKALNLLK
jgi:hypothetical protein